MKSAYDLTRFKKAHEFAYSHALAEIKKGRKRTHWMWYIFPQISGLGSSPTSRHYAISDLEEAEAFLADPYLGGNLREITSALLSLDTNDPYAVFGEIDGMKLISCMTLFSYATEDNGVFLAVLDKYYGGRKDNLTEAILLKNQ